MAILVEIIATGDELLNNTTENATTPFLINQMTSLGYEVRRIVTVGDNPGDIVDAVRNALRCANLIFITGGLGPTPDDVTREAVAESINRPLEFRSDLWDEIQDYLIERGLAVSSNNMKQAYLPCGGEPLRNYLGTAPGILIPLGDQTIIILPGPPGEAREMFLKEVKPYIVKHYPPSIHAHLRTLKICGPGETIVLERLKEIIEEAKTAGVNCSFLPRWGEVHLVLKWDPQSENTEFIRYLEERIRAALGADLYGVDEDTLSSKVGELLLQHNLTVGVAESCTGGLVANYLTDVQGSSRYVRGGIIAYTNDIKENVLGVNRATLEQYGAVSPQTAKEMARGVCRLMGTPLGLSTTGFAGPGGGVPDNPVGTVYMGLATPEEEMAQKIFFPGLDRITLKSIAARRTIDLMRRYLITLNGGNPL